MRKAHHHLMLRGRLRQPLWSLLCCVLMMVMFSYAHADEPENENEQSEDEPLLITRSWDFGIGLGFGELSNPFIGADDVPAYVTIDLAIYGKRFFFDNGDLGFTLVDKSNVGFNLLATYSSDRIFHSFFNRIGLITSSNFGGAGVQTSLVDLDNAPAVVGAGSDFATIEPPDRNFAINLGVELLLSGVWGELDIELVQDVSGAHNGQELVLDYGYGWRFGRWTLRSSAGINWKSSRLVDYYYGFLPEENAALSAAYSGQSTFNAFAGISTAYKLTDKLSLVGTFKYERLGSNITESPLIVEDKITTIFVGTFYRF